MAQFTVATISAEDTATAAAQPTIVCVEQMRMIEQENGMFFDIIFGTIVNPAFQLLAVGVFDTGS